MINKYEQYKPSAFEWLSEIPENWHLVKLKNLANVSFSSVDRHEYKEELEVKICHYPDAYKNEEINSNSEISSGTCTAAELNNYKLKEGQIIITKDSESANDIGVPVFISETIPNSVCGYHLAQITVKKNTFSGKYLFRYFQTKVVGSYFETNANGVTRFGLGKGVIKNLIVPLPSFQEQTKIAQYLDHQTSLIDAIIEKKQQLIEKLKEQRRAIINEAVTKGLDPEVPMKESGVKWLGEIPEHWEVSKLKYLLEENLKYGANESALEANPEHPRFIRITDFGKNGKLKHNTYRSLKPEVAEEYLLKEGDILLARSGATVGKTFQFKNYSGKACFAGYLIKASVNCKVSSDFLYLFTKSGIYGNWKNSVFIQATIQNISAEKYNNLILPIPPIQEQEQIFKAVQEKISAIDVITKKVKHQLEMINSYRQSLISEAVTGKIDVREWEPSVKETA